MAAPTTPKQTKEPALKSSNQIQNLVSDLRSQMRPTISATNSLVTAKHSQLGPNSEYGQVGGTQASQQVLKVNISGNAAPKILNNTQPITVQVKPVIKHTPVTVDAAVGQRGVSVLQQSPANRGDVRQPTSAQMRGTSTPPPIASSSGGVLKFVCIQMTEQKDKTARLDTKLKLTLIRQVLVQKTLVSTPFRFKIGGIELEELEETNFVLEEALVPSQTEKMDTLQLCHCKEPLTRSTVPSKAVEMSDEPSQSRKNVGPMAAFLPSQSIHPKVRKPPMFLNGLAIYELPQILPKPNKNRPDLETLSSQEEEQALYVLITGETGVGKSTLVNMIANYLYGVGARDNFRYQLIAEGTPSVQAVSQTSVVNMYAIKSQLCSKPIVLIDSPGYGDTRGLEYDAKIDIMITQLLNKELSRINMICFATKATTIRFTEVQKHICNKVQSLLPQGSSKNTRFLFTFCDFGEPQVAKEIRKSDYTMQNLVEKMGPDWYYKFNNSTLYTSYDPSNSFADLYWNLSVKGVKEMIARLEKTPAFDLRSRPSTVTAVEPNLSGLKSEITDTLKKIAYLSASEIGSTTTAVSGVVISSDLTSFSTSISNGYAEAFVSIYARIREVLVALILQLAELNKTKELDGWVRTCEDWVQQNSRVRSSVEECKSKADKLHQLKLKHRNYTYEALAKCCT